VTVLVSEPNHYSYVTLSKLGLRDVLPVSRLALSLTSIATQTGQIYLGVIITHLVGLLNPTRSLVGFAMICPNQATIESVY
jgi:hypothetical protein